MTETDEHAVHYCTPIKNTFLIILALPFSLGFTLILFDPSRIPDGPNRAPVLKVTPMS